MLSKDEIAELRSWKQEMEQRNAILDDHTGTASLDAGESTRQAHLDFSSVVIA